MVKETVDVWRELGVPERIVEEMLEFPALVEAAGDMRWSDLLVVLGRDAEASSRVERWADRRRLGSRGPPGWIEIPLHGPSLL